MLQVTQLDIETLGRNGQLCMPRAPRRSGRAAARSAATRGPACSAAPAPRLPDRRQARGARLLPAARGRGRGARSRRGQGPAGDRRGRPRNGPRMPAGFPTSAPRNWRATDGSEPAVPGRSAPNAGDQRRRRLRHPRAADAFGDLEPPPRPPSACPSRRLDRRPLPRGGARLGGRHAELLRRRVAAPGHPAGGDLHPALLRRAVAPRHRRRVRRPRRPLRQHRLDRRPPARPLRGPRLAGRRRGAAPRLQAHRRRGARRCSSASHARPRSISPPVPPRSIPTSARAR